jgi:hypothetical protein
MKYVKMLGVAAVAAMAFMAFLGASSASATVLCATTTTPCGSVYGVNTEIDASLASGTSAVLRNTSGSIEDTCTTSTTKGVTESSGSSTTTVKGKVKVEGETKDLTFGGCEQTTDVLAGGELEIHWISGTHNGTLTAKEFQVTMTLVGVTCTFSAGTGTDLGTVTGGSMATMDVNAVVNKSAGSFLCPSTAVWEAAYTVTNPEPLWISQ